MEAFLKLTMNEAVALARQDVRSSGLDDLLALVGLPSRRRSTGELSNPAEEILKSISSFVDGLLQRSIATQTKNEFVSVRKENFGNYAGAVTSLARLIHIVVPNQVIERVLDDSFCELEAEFREHGLSRFGASAKEQAMFTIWTMRRTSRLITKISALGTAPQSLKEQDEEIADSFSFYATWSQFHLDCMLGAIRFGKPIQLDVLPEIIDGLRGVVNAYGYARRGLSLRLPEEQPKLTPHQWDDEEQELLSSSMREMAVEALDG